MVLVSMSNFTVCLNSKAKGALQIRGTKNPYESELQIKEKRALKRSAQE